MPRIDPNQLLKCLSALLGTNGGIKSSLEVARIATLMTKFSKKLVSKCIYIQILKSTQSDLLVEFMAEGGWALVFQWLDDSIVNNNYPLIREILELLLLCPISLDRLKENNCPKVVKGLSKDSEDEQVKQLAGKLVEQWLKFIKSGQAAISDVAIAAAAAAAALSPKPTTAASPKTAVVKPLPAQTTLNIETVKKVPVIRKINKIKVSHGDEKSSSDDEVPPIGSLPLYKITVRDGKSVLAKVGTKTLIPARKSQGEAETVVLKSEAGAKNFRFVAKAVHEKSDASEITSDDSSSRDKTDEAKSGDSKINATERRENKAASDESSESSEKDKSKSSSNSSSSKSSKDVKSKDSSSKSKTHKDRDKEKSESRHRDKDRRESSKDGDRDKRKSDHKSHKSDKDRDKDRDRDKSKHKESSSKEKEKSSSRDKDKKDSKLLSSAEKAQIQADKDKDTLERLKTPAISSLGKIPKKSSSQSSNGSSSSSSSSSKSNLASKSSESPSAGDKSNSDAKKSGEVKKPEMKGPKPKTVKTFNSKFRSTGLEEEIKPPPPRSSLKKKIDEKKPVINAAVKPEVSSLKYPSTTPKDGSPPEKKSKIAEVIAEKKDKIVDKPGGIKLIPPKPKPTLLESDMFSDALTASTKLEPRKRKRRTSGSKDGPDIKKEIKDESGSGATSPKDVKPNLKFYRDTLEDDDEKNKENTDVKSEIKLESDSEESKQTGDGDDNAPISKLFPNGVLVHKTKKGPKKSVKWKEESDLITVKYFELDETERVNVTRNFVDMKLMERSHEREAFQLARKLASDDIMEEKIPYGPLYEVDIPAERRPAVEPGRSSEEKNVQYAREKTVLQAIYFHRSAIPDSPAEPDPESHPTTDPKIIPLEDITGNADSVSNFTNQPWPEPKPTLIPSSPPPTQTVAQTPAAVGYPAAGYSTVGNFAGFPAMGMPGVMPTGQGTWRTGDGKEMPIPMNFQPNGPMMAPPMAQPNMYPPEGFNMNGPAIAPGFNPGYGMGCDPSMYGPPPMGGMNPGGPAPQWNRGGWGQGPRGPCPPMNMPPKFPKGVCHHFAKFGNCQRGNSCRFMHPGVNCPPLT